MLPDDSAEGGVSSMSRHEEHGIAVALCQWWAYEATRRGIDPRLLIHIPNEGKRNAWTGKRLKDAGLRPGTPDYFLAIPNATDKGLFIELKAEKGRAQQSQKEMLSILREQGYRAEFSFGLDAALREIEFYLNDLPCAKTAKIQVAS